MRELIEAANEVLRISDRDHVAWHKLRACIAALSPLDAAGAVAWEVRYCDVDDAEDFCPWHPIAAAHVRLVKDNPGTEVRPLFAHPAPQPTATWTLDMIADAKLRGEMLHQKLNAPQPATSCCVSVGTYACHCNTFKAQPTEKELPEGSITIDDLVNDLVRLDPVMAEELRRARIRRATSKEVQIPNLRELQRWDIGYTPYGASIQHKDNGTFVKLEDVKAVLAASPPKQVDQNHIVELYSSDMPALREWLQHPNGSHRVNYRCNFEAVAHGGILVRTGPFNYEAEYGKPKP